MAIALATAPPGPLSDGYGHGTGLGPVPPFQTTWVQPTTQPNERSSSARSQGLQTVGDPARVGNPADYPDYWVSGSQMRVARASKNPWLVGLSFQISTVRRVRGGVRPRLPNR